MSIYKDNFTDRRQLKHLPSIFPFFKKNENILRKVLKNHPQCSPAASVSFRVIEEHLDRPTPSVVVRLHFSHKRHRKKSRRGSTYKLKPIVRNISNKNVCHSTGPKSSNTTNKPWMKAIRLVVLDNNTFKKAVIFLIATLNFFDNNLQSKPALSFFKTFKLKKFKIVLNFKADLINGAFNDDVIQTNRQLLH